MTDTDTDKKLLFSTEAADYLGITAHSLKVYRLAGEGPKYVHLGFTRGGVRYRKNDLDEWLQTRIVTPPNGVAPTRVCDARQCEIPAADDDA